MVCSQKWVVTPIEFEEGETGELVCSPIFLSLRNFKIKENSKLLLFYSSNIASIPSNSLGPLLKIDYKSLLDCSISQRPVVFKAKPHLIMAFQACDIPSKSFILFNLLNNGLEATNRTASLDFVSFWNHLGHP